MKHRQREAPPYYPPVICSKCPQRFQDSRCRRHNGEPCHRVIYPVISQRECYDGGEPYQRARALLHALQLREAAQVAGESVPSHSCYGRRYNRPRMDRSGYSQFASKLIHYLLYGPVDRQAGCGVYSEEFPLEVSTMLRLLAMDLLCVLLCGCGGGTVTSTRTQDAITDPFGDPPPPPPAPPRPPKPRDK